MTAAGRSVFALGQDAAPAAMSFAEARGCGVEVVPEGCAISPADAAVVFALADRVDPQFLDMLYPPDSGLDRVPGLVFAGDPETLRRRAVSIARQAGRAGPASYAEIHPYQPFPDLRRGARRIVGAQAAAEALHEALTAPAGVLTIATHSNGYDLLLGDEFALCTALEADAGRDPAAAPSCRRSGTCHRLKLPMADVPDSGRLIPAAALEARILLLLTCLGMVPAGGAVDPRWNYADALLDNPALAGMVTSWTLFVPEIETIERLLRSVYAGESLGRAVAAHNGRPGASRLAVLGDPDATAVPLPPEALEEVRYVRPKRRPSGDGGRFLSAMLYQAAMTEEDERAELAMVAADKLRPFEHCGLTGFAPTDGTSIGRETRDAVIAYLAACGNLVFEHWMPFVEARDFVRVPCDQCAGVAERYHFHLRHDGLPDRMLLLCPSCGIRADAPAGDTRSLTIRDGVARLSGPRPARDWRGVLHLAGQDRRLSTVDTWPSEADGRLAAAMELPERRPPGVLVGSLILLDDNALSVLSSPVPPGPGGAGLR